MSQSFSPDAGIDAARKAGSTPGAAQPFPAAVDLEKAARPPLVAVDRVVKRFGGIDTPPVLKGVELSIAEGEAVALLGSNGAGKSTLLRCLPGLTPVNEGTITIFGASVGDLRGAALRRLRSRIGFVFQRHNLSTRLSVLSNVVHGAQGRLSPWRVSNQATAPRAVREEAMDCLDQVGLADMAQRRADRLSGGQSQRVAVARALMQRPSLVLADEPVASLDPVAAEDVMTLFAGLMRNKGITLIFTSHDVAQATAFSDRVVALKAGRVALDRHADLVKPGELDWVYGH